MANKDFKINGTQVCGDLCDDRTALLLDAGEGLAHEPTQNQTAQSHSTPVPEKLAKPE